MGVLPEICGYKQPQPTLSSVGGRSLPVWRKALTLCVPSSGTVAIGMLPFNGQIKGHGPIEKRRVVKRAPLRIRVPHTSARSFEPPRSSRCAIVKRVADTRGARRGTVEHKAYAAWTGPFNRDDVALWVMQGKAILAGVAHMLGIKTQRFHRHVKVDQNGAVRMGQSARLKRVPAFALLRQPTIGFGKKGAMPPGRGGINMGPIYVIILIFWPHQNKLRMGQRGLKLHLRRSKMAPIPAAIAGNA